MESTEKEPLLKGKDETGEQGSGTATWSRISIYLSHTMSAWGERMWQFAVGLYLVQISPESLRLTAIYSFSGGLMVLLVGAHIGNWIDKTNRLTAARVTLVVQNASIVLCALAVFFTFQYADSLRGWQGGWAYTLCEVAIIVLADIGFVASIASTISVERDWVPVICSKDPATLTEMNAVLKRIDLTTKIIAPIVTGQIMTFASLTISAVVIAAWNFVSFFFEYFLLWKVYVTYPDLANKSPQKGNDADEQSCCGNMFKSLAILVRGWKRYYAQNIFPAGIALALLFLTVLGFDNITTGFAYSSGLSESVVSIFMSLAAVCGIVGTVTFPRLVRAVGVERTGLFSFTAQLLCLLPCVISIWVPGSPFDPGFIFRQTQSGDRNCTNISEICSGALNVTGDWNGTMHSLDELCASCESPATATTIIYTSIILLLSGIVLSRFGLWMSDLTVTQLLLTCVDEEERGLVNGVQSSLNQFNSMLKDLLVIVLPWPQTFGILVLISFSAIFVGACSYAFYSWKVRGHILPHQLVTATHDYREYTISNRLLISTGDF